MTPRRWLRSAPLHLAILRGARWLVPGPQRAEWFAEWRAELWYVKQGATLFCLGAFRDAFWLRRNSPAPNARHAFGWESPLRCVLFLAVLAAVTLFFAFRIPFPRVSPLAKGHFIFAYLFMILVSLLVLSATTPLALGEYPANRHSPPGVIRLRRWIFLVVKIALLLPIVFCGSLDLASLVSMGFQPHGFLVGLIVALRWALIDQRRRCPVCLRWLTNPTRIGGPSQTFLEWYGTELMCEQGHGLLYVPEIPTSCYSTQRWQYLDPSWRSLFS
jgi:hypothetical protein